MPKAPRHLSRRESARRPRPARLASGLARAAGFLLLWLALHGAAPKDLPVGVLAAVTAAGLSLRLLPPSGRRLDLGALARLALAFPVQSLRAGLDVARRALSPHPKLAPGLVAVPARLPEGTAREAFHAWYSLQPGTLPVAADAATTLVHALDTAQPVAEDYAAGEAAFAALAREPKREHGNG
ncbi:Na+/H+ antiporter subunit E [Starkeya koreensis]|uniref:Na+/H+ antiporter subunit E n=1 Tax=Ancylobacter koreensis TaxID=266121 RepID=A0ABT0DQY8_9HYPH|nr:Na+/H+ antiporter subunit E [Ancylobacter koreensis]